MTHNQHDGQGQGGRRHRLVRTKFTNLKRDSDSNILYAVFKRNGRQIKKSLKTTSTELGRRRLGEMRPKTMKLRGTGDAKTPFVVIKGREITGGVARLWYDSVAPGIKGHSRNSYQCSIRALSKHFTVSVSSITPQTCEAWAAKRSTECAVKTYNEERRVLRKILGYAEKNGYLMDNPAADVVKRYGRGKPILIPTEEQFQKLIAEMRDAEAHPHGYSTGEVSEVTEFLAATGCRIAEVLGDDEPGIDTPPMTWGDFDWKLKRFRACGKVRGEGGKVRYPPIFPALRQLVERMLSRRGYSAASPPPATVPIFKIKNIDKMMRWACRCAGLPVFHPHCMRHLFCSRAIEKGYDFVTISKWLGHSNSILVQTTYGHLRPEMGDGGARMTDGADAPPAPANVVQMPPQPPPAGEGEADIKAEGDR
jgi:integrase